MMQVMTSMDIFSDKNDGVVLFTCEEGNEVEERLSASLGPSIRLARERKEFEGKPKQQWLEKRTGSPRFILLVGLGKRDALSTDAVRAAAAAGAETLRQAGAKRIILDPPIQPAGDKFAPGALVQAATEGAMLRTYQFLAYKTKRDDIKELESISLASLDKDAVERGRIIASACNEARDLQNTPSCDLTPQLFAQAAAQVAKEEKLRCTILDKRQLIKQGYNAIVGVGKGSTHEPRLVTLEYAPKGAKKTIAIVGKGITFDSGGISIKPSEGMGEMKFDMSGAASVLGTIRAASRLRLPVRIIAILCLAENMPDGNSYKPGDVVRTKAGKTIEIDNTDAEGRVVLADGLYHATTFKPDAIIDVATLTGACVVALGDVAAGLLSNNQPLADALLGASTVTGEKMWQLPLWDDYAEDVKSSIADVKNTGVRGKAGVMSGAMLLKEFVGETPWAHIDTAGVAWTSGRERYFTGSGGTGYGVRLLVEYLRAL